MIFCREGIRLPGFNHMFPRASSCTDPDEPARPERQALVKKCFAHIEKLRASGVTIVLVSHDLPAVKRFSDRVILLEQGRITADGDPDTVLHDYLSRLALLSKIAVKG